MVILMYSFQKAVPIWGSEQKIGHNQFLGFRTDLELAAPSRLHFAIAARSFYRLYVNGVMHSHGPARTAKGYCRVDELELTLSGKVKIGIEVAALSKQERCSYDHTMEPGLLAAEIICNGQVLRATGDGNWWVCELEHRVAGAELISHCRGIVEYYRMNGASDAWRVEQETENRPIPITQSVVFLQRRAPYPTYNSVSFSRLEKVRSMIGTDHMIGGQLLALSRQVNRKWYASVEEKDTFVETLHKETEIPFSGRYTRRNGWLLLEQGSGADAFLFSIPKSQLGFIRILVEAEQSTIVDIIPSDHKDQNGFVRANTFAARYELAAGHYDLTTWEPKLAKYIKIIVRSEGKVSFSVPQLLDNSYPDMEDTSFSCSDGQMNRIYEGARRTLRLNTADIFMDCPGRERAGWLCDSYFTSSGAWRMFGDLGVEKDFIENFMLTDPADYADAFFPEVYPSKKVDQDPGLRSWSFWLLLELADFYRRSGDSAFVDCCFERVRIFLDTLMEKVGECGLFEDLKPLFVDWSLSNSDACLYPISVPSNCLICYSIEEMAELYHVQRWRDFANSMRKTINSFAHKWMFESDGFSYQNGRFIPNGVRTESGAALCLMCGFGMENRRFVQMFTEQMGTCPAEKPDPGIGKSNLFIGLMTRFVVLSRLGKTDTLTRELKDVYLPQLDKGSGTLFENIHAHSGCHGFNAMAGVLLINDVLGIGQPEEATKTVMIAPCPGNLTWAHGTAKCSDGMIDLQWRADHERNLITLHLSVPDGWQAEIRVPLGWAIENP